MIRRLILTSFLTVAAVAVTYGQAPRETQLFSGSVGINAGHNYLIPFAISESTGRVFGWFRASGGTNNDIYFYIMDAAEYENMRNGNSYRVYYESGRVTTRSFDVRLRRGAYLLVFSNAHALLMAKTVQGDIRLHEGGYAAFADRDTLVGDRAEVHSSYNYAHTLFSRPLGVPVH